MNYFKKRSIIRKAIKEKTGLNIPQNLYKPFFTAFEELEKINPEIQQGSLKYNSWQNIIYELDKGKTIEEVISSMNEILTKEYEEREMLNNDFERGFSEFFM